MLYHPLRYNEGTLYPGGMLTGVSHDPVITYEFPLLAKYRFRRHTWTPFVEAGPTFRIAGNLNGSRPSHTGAAVGAGAETRLGQFLIAPEIRFIRWTSDNPGVVDTQPNQLELLMSFSNSRFDDARLLGSHVSVGVVLGATLTPDFSTFREQYQQFQDIYGPGPRSFLVGPMVEVALPGRFSIELDAIHTPVTQHTQVSFTGGTSSYTQTKTTYNFPLLGKYRLGSGAAKPFIEAGPSFRDASGVRGASAHGATVGFGVETHFGRLGFAPALRYTYWGLNSATVTAPYFPTRGQIEVLSGFFF